jgi:hypothetical protein
VRIEKMARRKRTCPLEEIVINGFDFGVLLFIVLT